MIYPLRDETTALQMTYGRRSFDLMVWSDPTRTHADVFEITALVTPRGGVDRWALQPEEPLPVASAAAARRLLVLSYAHELPLRIVEIDGTGRRPTTARDAEFYGSKAKSARDILVHANRQLARGAGWLDAVADRELAAAALWRGTLLCNGLVRGAKPEFALRVATAARVAALRAAADVLEVPIRSSRTSIGLRIQLETDAAEALLDQLVESCSVSRLATAPV